MKSTPDEQFQPGLSSATQAERTSTYFATRLADEATDDPDTVRDAELELAEMTRSMNEERLRTGAEPIF